jgi:hypothetical protein
VNRLQFRTAVKNFINEPDIDEQIDSIVNSAIDEAYSDLSLVDKRVSTARLNVRNGIASLPDDLLTIIESTPKLDSNDRKIGNSIITEKIGTIAIKYVPVRELITTDDEDYDLHQMLNKAVINYCASQYFDYRKKTQQSQWLLNKYEKAKEDFLSINDNVEEVIVDVYGGSEDE